MSGEKVMKEELRASGSEARGVGGDGETLERALEKEMEEWMRREGFSKVNPWQREIDRLKEENMELLKRQNSKLVEEVERLRQENKMMEDWKLRSGDEDVGVSDWSEVSPPIPRPESPRREVGERDLGGLRFTPGGTQVPTGPPPGEPEVVDDRVPEFPWSVGGPYEQVQQDRRRSALGDWTWSPREMWQGRRASERMSKYSEGDGLERDGVCDGDRAWQRGEHREGAHE